MINKVLIIGGLALSAILLVENMVVTSTAYVFIESTGTWVLSLVSIIIGIGIGIGFKGIITKDKGDDDDYDF